MIIVQFQYIDGNHGSKLSNLGLVPEFFKGLIIIFRILLVDDEPSVLEGLRIFVDWNKAGYEIIGIASNGITAYSNINELHPDLVICDIRMPGMDGLSLIEKVNKCIRPIPKFLMLSGYNDFTYAQKALQLGALGYLTKPLDQEELVSELARVSNIMKDEKRIADETLEMIRYSKSQLYKDIIHGKSNSKPEWKKNFLLGIPEAAKLRTIRFIIENIQDNDNAPKYDIYMLLEKIAGIENRDYIFYNGNNSYTFLMHDGMKDFSDCSGLADSIAERLDCVNLNEFAVTSFWVLISSVSDKNVMDGICSCENEIEELNFYSMLHPDKRIFCYEKLSHELSYQNLICDRANTIFTKLPFDRIVDAIKGKDPDKVSSQVSKFFETLVHNAFTNELFSISLYRLADLVRKTASSFDIEVNSIIIDFIKSIRNKSPNCKKLAMAMCQQVFEKINSNNDKSIVLLEDEILSYIKQGCCKKLFNLQTIASNFSLPAILISKIVKKKTGQKFNDYVNCQRIEYAKKLIAFEDMKVATVCDESGYSDYDYFTKKFKELTGVSPSEYKKKYS